MNDSNVKMNIIRKLRYKNDKLITKLGDRIRENKFLNKKSFSLETINEENQQLIIDANELVEELSNQILQLQKENKQLNKQLNKKGDNDLDKNITEI